MKQLGRKIFFDKSTGSVILDTGEKWGAVIETTVNQDISAYTTLTERNRDTFDVLELQFREHSQNFAECSGYRVNVDTNELEFSYPNPNEPDVPQVFVKPLTEQIAELEAKTDRALIEITMIIAMGGMY